VRDGPAMALLTLVEGLVVHFLGISSSRQR
jgi:hypothetical protein